MAGPGGAAEPSGGASDGAGGPLRPRPRKEDQGGTAEPLCGAPPAVPQPPPAGLPSLLAYRRESSRAPPHHEAEEDTEPRCEYCGSLLRPFPFPEDVPFIKDKEYRFCCESYRELYEFIIKERERLKDASSFPRAVSIHEYNSETNQLQSKEQENQRQQETQLSRGSSVLPLEPGATEGLHKDGTVSYGLSQEPALPTGGTLVPAEPTSPKGGMLMPAESAAKPEEETELEPEPEKEPEEEPKPKEESELMKEPMEEPEPEPKEEPRPKPAHEPKKEPEPKPKKEPKPKPGPEPEKEPKEEPKPKEESELKKEPEPEPKPKEEPRPKPGHEPKKEPEPKPKKEPKPKPRPEPEKEPKEEPKPKEESELRKKPEQEPEPKPKKEPRPKPGPEPKEKPKPEPEKEPKPEESELKEPEPGPEPKEEPRPKPGPAPKEEPRPKLEKEPKPEESELKEPELEPEPKPKRKPKPKEEPRSKPGPEPEKELEPEEPVSCRITSYSFRPLREKVGKSKLVQKYYKHGRKFLTMLPDGTSQLFYPSGNLALIVTGEGDQLICTIQEDEPRTAKIRALFQSNGRSTCYYPNGDEWINMNIQGGQYLDQAGSRVRKWVWPNMSPGPHVPLSPIFISLNRHVGVRILAQDKIIVSFLAMGRLAKFNMGIKVQVTATSQLPAPAWLGKDELLLLAFRLRILQLFDRMRGCIDFPSSEQWNKMRPPAYLLTQAAKILERCAATDISDELRSSIAATVKQL